MPKLCEFENCRKQASYSYFFQKPERCREHKEDRKHQYAICRCGNACPVFGLPTDKRATCCSKCKTDKMVNIVTKKCKCGKHIPIYGLPTDKRATCCSKCKTDKMIDINNKKCKCGKHQPIYGLPTDTKATCCSKCKTDKMIDIINKRCKNCADWPDFQFANKKYKNYCARCFQRLFPKDPLTFQIRSKTKEIAVRDYINTIFDGFQHDKALFTGGCDCTHRRRIDHRKLIGNTLLCIETDEKQHKYYDKKDEKDRYEDLYMVFSGKWIFIRFNPDKYTNKKGVRKNPTIAKRLFRLKEEIEKQIKRIQNEENKELVEISYLYYDRFD